MSRWRVGGKAIGCGKIWNGYGWSKWPISKILGSVQWCKVVIKSDCNLGDKNDKSRHVDHMSLKRWYPASQCMMCEYESKSLPETWRSFRGVTSGANLNQVRTWVRSHVSIGRSQKAAMNGKCISVGEVVDNCVCVSVVDVESRFCSKSCVDIWIVVLDRIVVPSYSCRIVCECLWYCVQGLWWRCVVGDVRCCGWTTGCSPQWVEECDKVLHRFVPVRHGVLQSVDFELECKIVTDGSALVTSCSSLRHGESRTS